MSNPEKHCETKLSPMFYSVYNGLRDKLFLINEQCLISGFHRALLQSVTFISQLMHSVIRNVDVKIYVV